MIRCEGNDRILPLPTLLHRVEHNFDLGVDERNAGMVGLHILAPKLIILFTQFESESFITLGNCRSGQVLPQVRFIWCVSDLIQRVEIEILIGSQKRDVGFLNSTSDEERLVAVRSLLQPFRNLESVLSILVLCISQAAAAISRRRLRIELGFGFFLESFPRLAILREIDRALLCFKFLSCRSYDRKFIIFKPVVLMPCDVAVLMTRRVEDLPD